MIVSGIHPNPGVRPRRTCHTGCVPASGLAVDTRLIGEASARERILALCAPGTGVYRAGPFVIIIFAAPRRIKASSAPGAVLVRQGRTHAAAPLAPGELEALQTGEDSVVLINGGVATATPLDAGAREDVSSWIDVSAFTVIDGLRPLGDVMAAPGARFVEVNAADLRKNLGVAEVDDMTARLLRTLLRRGKTGGKTRPARAPGWLQGLVSLFESAGHLFQSLFSRAPAGTARSSSFAPPASPRLSWLGRLRESLAKALWASQLSSLIGRQYAKHLSRLIAMFDANDLDNALRNALPLNATAGLATRAPSLWFSWTRKNFSVTARNPGAATSISLDQRLYQMLEARYRQAFERLAAAGQIEKAAFVLAELLNASEEAVSFLERHGRLRLAAEIAEMRRLPPGLVIRQWFLAGEHERAIQIAQVTGAFADAVLRLESSHKEQSLALRLLWADKLASAGAYAAAIDVVWPAPEGRRLAFAWIDRAIAVGGTTGARMLARKAAWRPEAFPELRDQTLSLIRGDDEDTRRLALAFGRELAAGEPAKPARLLAGPVVRRLLRDGQDNNSKPLVKKLLDLSEDTALSADVRSSLLKRRDLEAEQKAPSLQARSEPLEITRLAADRGAVAIRDAAETADGRLLVAIGEAGALLLSRDGKVITRFAEPAHAIVMSDHGDRALLLAKRGEVFRISRLDLIARRLRPWRDARFDQFAPDYDGLTWFVAREGALYAIDATAADWRHVWKVAEDGVSIGRIRRSATWMSAHFHAVEGFVEDFFPVRSEVWTYELPGFILRRREGALADGSSSAQPDRVASLAPLGVAANGAFAGWKRVAPPVAGDDGVAADEAVLAHGVLKPLGKPWFDLPLTAGSSPKAPYLTENWAAAVDNRDRYARVQLAALPGQHEPQDQLSRLRAIVTLETGGETGGGAGVRIQGERMLIFDACGRLMVLCLNTGSVLREHRISG